MIGIGELREILAGLIDPVRASQSTQQMKNLKGDLNLIPLLLQLAMSDSEPGRASFLYQLPFGHKVAPFLCQSALWHKTNIHLSPTSL